MGSLYHYNIWQSQNERTESETGDLQIGERFVNREEKCGNYGLWETAVILSKGWWNLSYRGKNKCWKCGFEEKGKTWKWNWFERKERKK